MNFSIKRYTHNFLKYRFLLKELVVRDIKVKYKRSVLGILWTILSPLLTMVILTIVFSTLFKSNIPNFPVYFLCGSIMFQFFAESTNLAMNSIYTNSSLIRKVYIPKYMFPGSKLVFSLVNLGFSFIATFIVMLVTHADFHWRIIFLFIPVIYIFIFSFGIGLIMSCVAVFFRDMAHLYGILITAVNYLTPIFYPINILPDNVRSIIEYNPLYQMIYMLRQFLLYNTVPTLGQHIYLLVCCVVTLLIGLFVFYKKQDKFVLYI